MNDRFHIYPRSSVAKDVLLVSLILGFMGCQSTRKKPGNEQESRLVDTTIELAQTQLDQGEAKDALVTLKNVYSTYPDDPKILNVLGLTHLALKNFEKAKSLFEAAYEIQPSTMIALNLSAALLSIGQTAKTRSILLSLLEDPQYDFKERILHNIGLSYEQEGDIENAKSFYKKALAENPIYYLSSLRLGKIHKKLRNLKLAIMYFEEASKNCPPCFEPVAELVKDNNQKKHYKRSTDLLKKYLNMKTPSQKDKAEAISMLNLTSALVSSR